MARIAGVDLPREKRIEVGLTYVYGIGQSTADEILAGTGINPDTRVKDLSADDEAKIRDYIRKSLPCRGQRTKTNARTCKGPKRTVANKKK